MVSRQVVSQSKRDHEKGGSLRRQIGINCTDVPHMKIGPPRIGRSGLSNALDACMHNCNSEIAQMLRSTPMAVQTYPQRLQDPGLALSPFHLLVHRLSYIAPV